MMEVKTILLKIYCLFALELVPRIRITLKPTLKVRITDAVVCNLPSPLIASEISPSEKFTETPPQLRAASASQLPKHQEVPTKQQVQQED